MTIAIVHGRVVERRGRRFFAVPKTLTLTDRIASLSQRRGNWDRVMTHHRTARLIRC